MSLKECEWAKSDMKKLKVKCQTIFKTCSDKVYICS